MRLLIGRKYKQVINPDLRRPIDEIAEALRHTVLEVLRRIGGSHHHSSRGVAPEVRDDGEPLLAFRRTRDLPKSFEQIERRKHGSTPLVLSMILFENALI